MRDRCPKGHLLNQKNVRVKKLCGGKVTFNTCRICESIRRKLQYDTDPAYRQARKQAALARYYRNKAQNALQN